MKKEQREEETRVEQGPGMMERPILRMKGKKAAALVRT